MGGWWEPKPRALEGTGAWVWGLKHQAGQAHFEAACISPKGPNPRPFWRVRCQACQVALTAWEGILDT